MAVPIFNSNPSYLTGAGGIRQGSNIPLNLPSSLVRPTSAATRAVEQARIRKGNEERLKGISDAYNYVTRRGNLMFDDAGVVMQDAYDNASVAIPQAFTDLGNFAGDVAYNTSRDMAPIFQLGRDIKEGVGPTFDAVVSGAKERVDPMLQEISSGIDNLNAEQAIGFKEWLKTPAGKSYEKANGQSATSQLIDKVTGSVSSVSDSISQLFNKDETPEVAAPKPPAIKEDLTEEAKTFNTAATVVSPSAPEEKQDWFNAVNDRIDLMAMGAAMLAGSGQRGATTMSRLGEGLQAGLASRAAQAKAAENKQYKDALLLLEAQKARAAGIPDPFKNYSSKINDISSFMAGSGFEGDNLTELSRLVHGVDTNFVSYPAATKKAIADEMATKGSNWFSAGGELSITDAEKTYLEARKAVAQRLAK